MVGSYILYDSVYKSNRSTPGKSTSNSVPGTANAPHLVVNQSEIDYGDVVFETTLQSEFSLYNTGNLPLVILDEPQVEVVKGCCPPRAEVSTMTIDPGQQATLSLKFTMAEGMGGPHEFHVQVRTNDPQEPEQELVVLSNWIGDHSVAPGLSINPHPSFKDSGLTASGCRVVPD
jgi:hypothetical protein